MNKKITLIIGIFIGLILSFGIGIYAASEVLASNIKYKDGTVEDALNDLYNIPSTKKVCRFVDNTYGNKGQVGAKYECDPGDGVTRNFYIYSVGNDSVDMIMDRNIEENNTCKTLTYQAASSYANGLNATWDDVIKVELPKAQIIANIVNANVNLLTLQKSEWFCFGLKDRESCIAGGWSYATEEAKTAIAPYQWLINYMTNCTAFGCDSNTSNSSDAYGYWTSDIVLPLSDTTQRAWYVYNRGALYNIDINGTTKYGVRPVITVMKSNLYE